jgi:hypothetical protein
MSGTWTTHIKSDADKLVKVSSKLDPITAATIRTNPGTGKSKNELPGLRFCRAIFFQYDAILIATGK